MEWIHFLILEAMNKYNSQIIKANPPSENRVKLSYNVMKGSGCFVSLQMSVVPSRVTLRLTMWN
jgi:hypothetical protein